MRTITSGLFIAALLATVFSIASRTYGGVESVGEVSPTLDPGGYGTAGQPNSVAGDVIIGIDELGGVFVNNDFGTGILLNTGDGIVGQNEGSSGAVEITNFPLGWFMEGDLIIGDAGWGYIDLINSAKLQVGAPLTYVNVDVIDAAPVADVIADSGITTLGRQQPGYGQLTLTNRSAQLVSNTLIVGDYGAGDITAVARATIFTETGYIGNGDASVGYVSISDSGTRWTVGDSRDSIDGRLVIGNLVGTGDVGEADGESQLGKGQGTLLIANKGLVQVSDEVLIGPSGQLQLQTEGRLRILPTSEAVSGTNTSVTDVITNFGRIEGSGYVDFIGVVDGPTDAQSSRPLTFFNTATGTIFNDGNATGTLGGTNSREKLIFTGTAVNGDLLTNDGTIHSDGGHMVFDVPVTNNLEIIAIDALMDFNDGLLNNATGTVIVGGDSTLHGVINPAPLSNFVILNDSIVTITGDLIFTEPFLLSDGDEGDLVAAMGGNEATLSIGIGQNPGYLTVSGNLDLTNAVLDLDFAGSTAPELGDIVNLIQVQGEVTGTFQNSTVNVGGQVWEIDYSGGDIFATFAGVDSLPGDFDGDGDVDGRDFLAWQRNPTIGDLSDWQQGYGQNGGSLTGNFASVPEPGTMVLLLGAAVGFIARKR